MQTIKKKILHCLDLCRKLCNWMLIWWVYLVTAFVSLVTLFLLYLVWNHTDYMIRWMISIAYLYAFVAKYILDFMTWEFGPILSYWNALKITAEFLQNTIELLTVFYSSVVNLINENDWIWEESDKYINVFMALNSTYFIIIICFVIILCLYVSELTNNMSKKLWLYITIIVFFISLVNLHYINPMQLQGVDYVNLFIQDIASKKGCLLESDLVDDSIFRVHCSKKPGLLLCVLVSYIFILCAYIKQIVCTKHEMLLYLALEYFLLKAFTTSNLLEFYIYYEAVLIPMYLLIIGWGSGEAKKGLAAYYLLFYTVIFSIPFLTSILYLGYKADSYDINIIKTLELTFDEEFYIFIALFVGFAVKIPMFPFHIWLPEAHVNAPTTASVILASLLLKLGGYGMITFLLPICSRTCLHYSPFIYALITISIIYGSMAAIVQTDLKRIVAYSSIAHMNLAVLGIFAWNSQGVVGSIYQMISHGIISAALFFLVGFLYDRHHTRDITYYGGLTTVMPVYSTNFFFFTIANMGFPGTSAFVGELLIFIGAFKHNTVVASIALIGAFLSAVYSVWMFNRIFFGSLNTSYLGKTFFDLNRHEFIVMLYLLIPLIVLGVCPNIILDYLSYFKYFF